MRSGAREALQRIDWWLLAASLALSGMGLLLIHSLASASDARFLKQLVFLGLGIGVLFSFQLLDSHFWRNASIVLYAAAVLLLAGLLIFGETTRGSRGWITLGSIGFQPSEFAKLAVILFLATTLERLRFDLARFPDVVAALAIVVLPAGLIAAQPDMGSAIILLAIGGGMVLATGLDRKKIGVLVLLSLCAAALAWFAVLAPYQKDRIRTFMDPQSDPLGSGYNVTQSVVAIGSGGLFGRGLGLGTQSQLNFLPEQETDFIFASTAEELGFLGASTILLLYAFLLWRLWRIMACERSMFSNFLALGVLLMFFSQAVVNIGMNLGLLPVTGVTLPLVSYGGSSLLASFAGIGIAFSSRT
ncbi:MAG: rod shape-determining protein RodA [Patescibacteria group bacterium]|nr:rod shape-determining protein RodA [bacterium]MDZ4221494.1 rod shape-determining protein RodA [Patescibacteria group bacterium]